MNKIAVMDFSQEDMEQFAQLIGYSICGFSELSYVSNDTYNAAEKMANGTSEAQARIEALEDTLKTVRDGMRGPVAALYKICEEDLEV